MRTVVWLLALAALARPQGFEIDGGRIRAHTEFLAGDLLEGRGVGTRGGALTTQYLATQLELAGARPAGDDGTWFQRVPLTGVETQPGAALTFTSKHGSTTLRWLDDFVGVSQQQQPKTDFDAEVVFAGHGITAPEFNWDDYRDVDVRGKLVVVFTNEPPSKNQDFFAGPALTYYGRWPYKYENALRHGAVGAIIIHTPATAGYGWDVLRSSGHEDPQVKLAAGEVALAFAGWLTQQAGGHVALLAGKSVEKLLLMADGKGFRAFPLGVQVQCRFTSKVRDIESRNVAALIPGSDPRAREEAVIFTAHWDHLGVGEPVEGDRVYNGAVDNATGCAMLLEIARAWAALQQKPKRSALFLFTTAEEAGLRGALYYAAHPLWPPGKTAFGINIDAFFPAGLTRDIVVLGAERTTAWPLVQDVARQYSLTVRSDPRPEQGSYYRSDHFALARIGIPAVSLKPGAAFEGKPPDYALALFQQYNTRRYHQPSDDYHDGWDFAGIEQGARFAFALGTSAAAVDRLQSWQPGDEFLAARESSGVR